MKLTAEIADFLGLGLIDVHRIVSSAPKRYKTYPIAKRQGGERIIAQPSRELKAIQRFLISTKLRNLPIHPAAAAYVEGRGILQNAEAHKDHRVILKLDFIDFFPSLLAKDWVRYVRTQEVAHSLRDDLAAYTCLLFWGKGGLQPKCLSIGAPSSPLLSNVLMYGLDCQFALMAQNIGVAYTRYADDITISANSSEQVIAFEVEARRLLRKTNSPKLLVNESKRGLYLKGQRRMVTGLIITPTGQVSIGRERKRLISAMLHRVALDTAEPQDRARLKGLLGFSIAVEPQFMDRMRTKYGSQVVDQALQYHIPSIKEREALDLNI